MAELARTWYAGWLAVRRYASRRDTDGTFVVTVGGQHRDTELVVLDPDHDRRALDRAAQRAQAQRRTWLKVVTADVDRTTDHLGEHRMTVLVVETLMCRDLRDHPLSPLPEGHTQDWRARHDRALRVRVSTLDGSTVASGQAGMDGTAFVPDRILVAPGHRRRGLGAAIMSTLAREAVDRGNLAGLLVASSEGRRLYESLGWQPVADVLVTAPR